MRKNRFIFIVLVFTCLTGCTVRPFVPSNVTEIIEKSGQSPDGFNAVVTFQVKGADSGRGSERGFMYLNSKENYRDPLSLNVMVHPGVVRRLFVSNGIRSPEQLKGEVVRVKGTAKRVRINFFSNGRKTDKFYYQTHLNVTSIDQLQIHSKFTKKSRD